MSFLFASGGSASGTLQIRNWEIGGSNVVGVEASSLTTSFLNSIYFTGIGAGISANLSENPISISGYGNYYIISPIQTFVWNGGTGPGGGGGDENWSTGNNWDGAAAPGAQVRQAIVMAGSSKTINNMDGAFTTNSLVFRDSSFTIESSTGNTLTVGGGGILNEAVERTQDINVQVFLDQTQIWNAREGNLSFGGNINLQTSDLTLDGANDFTMSGSIAGDSTATLTLSGDGTTTFSGSTANTFAGDIIIDAGTLLLAKDDNITSVVGNITVNNGGTLELGATQQLANTSDVTLGGGTLRVAANLTETMGSLTLTANSVIDFGGGEGILNFDSFVSNDYTLTIINWAGDIDFGNGSDQIYFGSTLTAYQLSKINFSPIPSRQLQDGEVVPIPEPSTYFAGALILGFLGWRERRRIKELWQRFCRRG